MSDSIFTLDDENNAAINTVMMNGIVESNKKDIFTEDENGNAAIRVVGGAGSAGKNNIIIKSDTIPAASAEELGRFYCYSGETDADFHHGYVYECVKGTTTYSGTVTFEPATLSGTVVAATAESLANLASQYITGDITSIVSGTMTYDQVGDLWVFVGKDENDSTVGSFQLYTQDFIDAGFTFTGTPQDGDVVAFTCTVTETSTYTWERIDLQPAPELGRYLSSWDCSTGLAGTNPPQSPYTYATGDYFIVSAVATGGGTNYKPDGSSYVIGQASTTVESEPVAVNDTYFYDGTNWTLLKTGSTVSSVNGRTGDLTSDDVLPDQSGHANEFLMTDGATATWKAVKPEDIGAVTQTTQQVTLMASDWQAGTPIMQGLSVPGVTPTNTVVVSPDPASATDYASAGVICVAQGTDYLEFNCTTQPANDLVVNILLLN